MNPLFPWTRAAVAAAAVLLSGCVIVPPLLPRLANIGDDGGALAIIGAATAVTAVPAASFITRRLLSFDELVMRFLPPDCSCLPSL